MLMSKILRNTDDQDSKSEKSCHPKCSFYRQYVRYLGQKPLWVTLDTEYDSKSVQGPPGDLTQVGSVSITNYSSGEVAQVVRAAES